MKNDNRNTTKRHPSDIQRLLSSQLVTRASDDWASDTGDSNGNTRTRNVTY